MPMTLDGTAGMTAPQGAVYNGLQMATAQASTSGTSIDFTGIPVWVKRITVMLNGVSTNGTSNLLLQIGSGAVDATATYSASVFNPNSVNGGSTTQNGYLLTNSANAAAVMHGNIIVTNISGNIWVANFVLATPVNPAGSGAGAFGGGSKTLSGVLDRIRITTVNGTDTFDAGSINIMYE